MYLVIDSQLNAGPEYQVILKANVSNLQNISFGYVPGYYAHFRDISIGMTSFYRQLRWPMKLFFVNRGGYNSFVNIKVIKSMIGNIAEPLK